MQTSTFSAEAFDRARAAHPDLALNLYAMTPGAPVVFEVLTPEGFTATWEATTAAEAIRKAFPYEDPPVPPAAPSEPPTDIFS